MADTRECEQVREQLAAAVDGDAPAAVREHMALCDACRDLRHAAQRAADLVADAGADYAPPADLESRLMAALDARAASAAPPAAVASTSASDTAAPAPVGVEPAAPVRAPVPAPVVRPERMPAPLPRLGASPRRGRNYVIAAALAAAAAVPFLLRSTHPHEPSTLPAVPTAMDGQSAWHGRLGAIVRAADGNGAGVEIKLAGANGYAPLHEGEDVPAGATVRTDARTRARLEFSDGTRLVLDHGSEFALDAHNARAASLARGAAVADVAHLEGSPRAHIQLPNGAVTVLGTKFALDATAERSTVRVTRGTVKLSDTHGDEVPVQTGQQGVVPRGGNARVEPAPDLAGSVAWADLSRDVRVEPDAPVLGLGELRARRPGESAEHDQRVHLASHAVRVRVAGTVARTEVDEVFRNDTGSELEGIFRFPLPPDAQIESLALDVRGEMEQGEFVDRQRASAIWRGVIRNAVHPVSQRVETQEFVWVPGPWRDPALLEWQRGGRFELRVFPIPAHGERRVSIAYTQTVPAQGGVRRYVYPLAHDAAGSTRVDHFTVDAQVLGADAAFGVHPRGYELTPASATVPDATRLAYNRDAFVPAGDIVLEYALPDHDAPVTAWAFRPPTESARPAPPTVGVTNEPGAVYALPTREPGYVAVALRPTLPRWSDTRPRDYALLVDASRSMVGERLARARRLLTAMVAEMDPRDRVTVLACDTTCRTLPGGLAPAGTETAHRADSFLAAQEAGGASDLVAQVRAAVTALGSSPDRDARVVYLGDGAPTAGYRRPDRVEAGISAVMPAGRASLTAVAVGSDADTGVLAAMARAGGGAVVPYVPGESLSAAALSVLQTTYGVALRDATVTLPAGLTAVYPSRLGAVRPGAEVMVFARMAGDGESVQGDVVLRGTVGGELFEARYPLRVVATEDTGNAFVARLYTAAQIADLEATESEGMRAQIVRLSQRFHVASRYTSLLVLESDAMYRAFNVQRDPGAWWTRWTGERTSAPTEQVQNPAGYIPDPNDQGATEAVEGLLDDASPDTLPEPANQPSAAGESLRLAREHSSASVAQDRAGADMSADEDAVNTGDNTASAQPAPAAARASAGASVADEPTVPSGSTGRMAPATTATTTTTAPANELGATRRSRPMGVPIFEEPPRPRGQWMRRIHVRRASLGAARDADVADMTRVQNARIALSLSPDSRDRHVELYRALSIAGEADEAAAVAARWAGRDAMDPDALARLADAAARAGDRERAIRMLAGVVDVRPNDPEALKRMATLHERAGETERACAYRISLAEVSPQDPVAIAGAARCERVAGREGAAQRWLEGTTDVSARLRAEALLSRLDLNTASFVQPSGDLVIDARWEGASDLDVAVITPRGNRVSWLDGRTVVQSRGARDPGAESLSLARLSTGSYLLEVSRTERTDAFPARGRLVVTALGRRQVFEFALEPGQSSRRVARVNVTLEEQLVPAF